MKNYLYKLFYFNNYSTIWLILFLSLSSLMISSIKSQDIGCGIYQTCDISNYNLCPPQFDYYSNSSHSSGQLVTNCYYKERYDVSSFKQLRIPINVFTSENSTTNLPIETWSKCKKRM